MLPLYLWEETKSAIAKIHFNKVFYKIFVFDYVESLILCLLCVTLHKILEKMKHNCLSNYIDIR